MLNVVIKPAHSVVDKTVGGDSGIGQAALRFLRLDQRLSPDLGRPHG